MAKYEKTINGQFEEVIHHLENDISISGITMNLVDESNYTYGDINIAVRVYDKYYMRNGASLSLTVVSKGSNIFISAIGAGEGKGIIFNFSLGAEDDMVAVVERSVEGME